MILACLKLQALGIWMSKRWGLDAGSWERPEEVTVNVGVQRCKAFWVNSSLPLRWWSKEVVSSFISAETGKRVTGFIFLLQINKLMYAGNTSLVCTQFIFLAEAILPAWVLAAIQTSLVIYKAAANIIFLACWLLPLTPLSKSPCLQTFITLLSLIFQNCCFQGPAQLPI